MRTIGKLTTLLLLGAATAAAAWSSFPIVLMVGSPLVSVSGSSSSGAK